MEGLLLSVVVLVVIYFLIRSSDESSPGATPTDPDWSMHGAREATKQTSPQITPRKSLFAIRLEDVQLDTEGGSISAKAIQVRGLFPIKKLTNLGVWVSIIDEDSKGAKPVLCVMERFQETDSLAYFMECKFGFVPSNNRSFDWLQIGMIFPTIMRLPRGGRCQLTAMVRLVDLSNPPKVKHGFLRSNKAGVLWQGKVKFTHQSDEKGYIDAAEHRDEAQVIGLRIAMAVAMSDGSLDRQEGSLMSKWIKQSIAPFSDERQEHMKEVFNQALRESYAEAKNGTIDLQSLAARLNDVGETGNKYQVMELCADVMAADGVAHAGEIGILNNLAEWLGLDMKRVSGILDLRIIKLDPVSTGGANTESLLGIMPDWPDERVKKHLRGEFSKWNNRLNTLSEGEERDNAQRMLDLIAEARKKYA